MYSRYLRVRQGHRHQDCPARFFKDLYDVTRQATEEYCGTVRPMATWIITNNSSPKTLLKIALHCQRRNSCPELGKLQFTKKQKKVLVGCSMRHSSYTWNKTFCHDENFVVEQVIKGGFLCVYYFCLLLGKKNIFLFLPLFKCFVVRKKLDYPLQLPPSPRRTWLICVWWWGRGLCLFKVPANILSHHQ